MAYTSVLPVHRLDRSIDYVKDRAKTTKSAGSLEEAIDYALNREKTEQTLFEDAMGCTCENAYVDMVKTKERFHKKEGVQGYHLVQSFAEEEVSPELAHLIGQELAEQLLKGQYEVVITTHLNTSHYHNHLVWNSVSMVDGKKYHSNAKSYFTEVRQISDQLCRKYGLSVIQTNQGKAMHYAQWKAEAEGKPTWRTAIRMDIQETIGVSFSWSQFVKEMEKRGYTWKLNRKYPSLKTPGMERYIRLRSLGKGYGEAEIREKILRPKIRQVYGITQMQIPKRKLTGLQKLYYSYLYQMGVFPKKPKRIPYAVRSDIQRLDQRITRPGYDLATLESCILSVRQKYGVQVYLEPGEAWALNAGYLVTTVLDTLHNGDTSLAILDMSAACHTPDVIEMPYRPPLLDAGEAGEKACTVRLGGPTCLAGDIVGDYSFDVPLTEGDKLIFGDMAIYTTCKNNTFNGMPLPPIWLLGADGSCRELVHFGYQDFKMRLGAI